MKGGRRGRGEVFNLLSADASLYPIEARCNVTCNLRRKNPIKGSGDGCCL